ncbi:MAG: preprotein translocase subunit SecY [Acidobacteria bacterium]|nr:preprotein translocase subunit SecY [Acidobacteriota bacterium]
MLQAMLNSLRSPELRKKLWFTAVMLLVFRFGSYVPVPGVEPDKLAAALQNQGTTNILNFLNLFAGGALTRFAVFALGIMPYITASIILQLLTVVIPSLERLQKEGESGYAKITQYTRYMTVGLAFLQSFAYVMYFRSQDALPGVGWSRTFLIIITLTAGTTLVMWIGELITNHGIGNGISLLIFCSIVSALPQAIRGWLGLPPVTAVIIGIIAVAIVLGIVFVNEGVRRIPIQYAKRQVGRRMTSGGTTYMPIRVNMAGVIPVIFAASITILPPTIAELAGGSGWAQGVADFLSPGSWWFILFEGLLIVLFTYFYTAVQFNPTEQADNLKKYGGFIPGVRPGRPTAIYLDRVVSRLTLPGAIYLALVAEFPNIIFRYLPESNVFFGLFGGTSILIVVGVALDTMRQMEAQLMMRSYEGFLQ